jgi:hypothetical protein
VGNLKNFEVEHEMLRLIDSIEECFSKNYNKNTMNEGCESCNFCNKKKEGDMSNQK